MSKRQWQQADLFPEAEAARRRGIRPGASALLVTLVLLVAAFLLWAGFTEIDEVTRAQGKVVSSLKTQVIQNLEGGILAELYVQEGDTVEKGDRLLRIDNTIASAQYQKSRAEYLGLLGEVTLLKAESRGEKPDFPQEIMAEAPDVVRSYQALYRSRKEGLEKDLEILGRQKTQRRQESIELVAKAAGLKRSQQLFAKELEMNRPLLATGATSESELLRLERTLVGIDNDIVATELAIPRGEAAFQEATNRIEGRKVEFRSEALAQLGTLEARLAAMREIGTAEQDRVRRTLIVAPTAGIVKQINFNTASGVIRPGDPIMEIVPIDESLRVEAWVSPQDVAFLRPELPGKVNVTAYDPSIYGGLDATLEEISADTFVDPEGNSLYRIYLRTTSNLFAKSDQPLPIIPGMTASVDILTGKKSILDYILKPIRRAQQRALRER